MLYTVYKNVCMVLVTNPKHVVLQAEILMRDYESF